MIDILSADYGRADGFTCPGSNADFSAALSNSTCNGNVLSQTASSCNGQSSCTVKSDFSPDPCSGILKYTVITYICVVPSPLGELLAL